MTTQSIQNTLENTALIFLKIDFPTGFYAVVECMSHLHLVLTIHKRMRYYSCHIGQRIYVDWRIRWDDLSVLFPYRSFYKLWEICFLWFVNVSSTRFEKKFEIKTVQTSFFICTSNMLEKCVTLCPCTEYEECVIDEYKEYWKRWLYVCI